MAIGEQNRAFFKMHWHNVRKGKGLESFSTRAYFDNTKFKTEFVMKKVIRITNHVQQAIDDRKFWRGQTHEARLDALETLRLEAGKFLYEYPARLQRVVGIIRKAQR